MAHSREAISAFRYGFGFGTNPPPTDTSGLVAQLGKEQNGLSVTAHLPFKERALLLREMKITSRPGNRSKPGGDEKFRDARRAVAAVRLDDFKRLLIRSAFSDLGFKERLVSFWADHFTTEATTKALELAVPDMIETAIRPNIGGNFSGMLTAVTLHPAMLAYLNQNVSVGPNSREGRRRGRGMNENLARELLELHTLGVSAGYTQNDVRELAELLTGLKFDNDGFFFFARAAEPGAEEVLGSSYGGDGPALADITTFLRDLSRKPETAQHLCRKLAVHFISDEPDAGIVSAMSESFLESDGNLSEVYRTLLDHPAAWSDLGAKIRLPFEFVAGSIRALGIAQDKISALTLRQANNDIVKPLSQMGQRLYRPGGPDGWSEDPGDWITPPALSARIIWGSKMAARHGPDTDIAPFLEATLGNIVTDNLRLAVSRASSQSEAVSLILASPEFNRR